MPSTSANYRLAAPPDFACARHEAERDTVRVVLSGELDLASSEALDRALRDAHPRVIVDLRALTFIDCSSLSLLVSATDRARAVGGRFRVIRGTSVADRLLHLTGMERRLELIP